jgi:hypothetical protein
MATAAGRGGARHLFHDGAPQLVFIDGDQSVEGAWRDFLTVEPLVNYGMALLRRIG